MKKLLEGIRVLDLTQAYSGPFCCMNLADHGAEVIKIEPPQGDQTRNWAPFHNGYSAYYAYFNRNKQGLCLDLKSEEGKELLYRLIAKSDVVIENFKAGTFERLGFSYGSMKAVKPDIIYGQITGFGLSGPMSGRPAYDIVAQAESGMMSMNGYGDSPPVKIGPSIADSFTGTYLALAVMMALFDRERTGEGCHVDVAMLDAMFSVMESYVLDHTLLGKTPRRSGNTGQSLAPWDMFRCRDGYFVAGCGTERHWQIFARALGLKDMAEDPEFDSVYKRLQKNDYLKKRIEESCAQLPLALVEERLTAGGVPFGKVNDISQAAELPQIKHRGMLWNIFDPGLGCEFRMPGNPMKFGGREDRAAKAAPTLGQDSERILRELAGCSAEELERLKSKGIIRIETPK